MLHLIIIAFIKEFFEEQDFLFKNFVELLIQFQINFLHYLQLNQCILILHLNYFKFWFSNIYVTHHFRNFKK